MQLDWKKTLGIALLVLGLIANISLSQEESKSQGESKTQEKSKTEAQPKSADRHQTLVLKNATIHTMAAQGTFVGDVLVSNGKIEAIGSGLKAPRGAKVIELDGYHLVPGLIESRGKLWLTSGAIAESNTKAELNVVDAIDPWSKDWQELASQGITSVYVQPNSTSSLGGYGAVLRVRPWMVADDSIQTIVLKKDSAIQASIGIRGATSKDRLAQVKALEKLLKSAKEKKKESKSGDDKKSSTSSKEKPKDAGSDKEKKKGKSKKETSQDAKDSKEKPESDKDKDKEKDRTKIALRRVLNREIPLHVEVHHVDALKHVLGLAKEFKIRVILDGLTQVSSSSAELIDANIPFVVGPFMEPGATPAFRKNADLDWVSVDLDSGRLWSLSGFPATARGSRWLRVQAAMAIRSGVDPERALAAVTSNPARMLGVGDWVGTLAPGKDADIAVFAGDPLDPSTPTRLVMSQGKITYENQAAVVGSSDSSAAVSLPDRLPSRYALKTTRFLRDGKFVEATIVVADGKIVSVGKRAKGGDLRLFDLQDTIVSPGLVVASSSLGQAAAINDGMESDASHLRSVDAVDPTLKQAESMLAGGFIHVGLSPGVTNTSAGVVGHVRLGSGHYVANPTIANQFVLSKSARKNDRFPASLNGQLQLLNGLFEGRTESGSVYVTSAIRRSIQQEKLSNVQSVADGDRQAVLVAHSDLEIRSAIALAKKRGLSPALLSSGRVGDMAERLAAQKFGLIVAPVSDTAYDTSFEQIVAAQKAGVPVAFAGETAEKIRITAALLVAAGMPRESALKGLTEGGAAVVGMENTGLKKGATADFVVWSGSPLDLSSKPLNIVVDGKTVNSK